MKSSLLALVGLCVLVAGVWLVLHVAIPLFQKTPYTGPNPTREISDVAHIKNSTADALEAVFRQALQPTVDDRPFDEFSCIVTVVGTKRDAGPRHPIIYFAFSSCAAKTLGCDEDRYDQLETDSGLAEGSIKMSGVRVLSSAVEKMQENIYSKYGWEKQHWPERLWRLGTNFTIEKREYRLLSAMDGCVS